MSLTSQPDGIAALLNSREKILWSGRPRQGLMLKSSDTFLIPFSLMWGGFAIFWESMAVKSGGPLFFILWGIPFVLFGLYLIFGRFFADSLLRAKTYYALTSERVLIIGGLFGRKVTSLELRSLPEMEVSFGKSDTGTISFGRNPSFGGLRFSFGNNNSNPQTPPQFEGISGVATVMARVRDAQARLLKPDMLPAS